LPHLHGTDGFFAAVFERKAEVVKPKEDKETVKQEAEIDEPKTVKVKTEKPKAAKE
jgi:hypothetical protein